MRHQWFLRARPLLMIAFAITMGVCLAIIPVHAHPLDTSGYSLTLTITNGSTFGYGGTTPVFLAYLTIPQGAPSPSPTGLVLKVDGQGFAGTVSLINGKLAIRTAVSQFPPGAHTAIQTAYIAESQTTIQSNAVVYTVRKMSPELDCAIQNLTYVYHPGELLHITSSFGTDTTPLDWQDGTYTIQFSGPQAITDANVSADSNDVITVPAPDQIGDYKLTCKFNGTPSVDPVTGSTVPLTVSLEHQVGSVQVFTNPTTLVAGQPSDMYVVFHAAPGLPTPTGRFNIEVDNAVSTPVALGPDGTGFAHSDKMPVFGNNHFIIAYSGDPYYASAVFTFPLTNPPIPTGSSGGSTTSGSTSGNSSTSRAQATTTPAKMATSTSTETVVAATPTAATSSNVLAVLGTTSESSPLVWLAIALILLALGSGAGGIFFWRRRAKHSTPVVSQTPSPDFTPHQWPPLDE